MIDGLRVRINALKAGFLYLSFKNFSMRKNFKIINSSRKIKHPIDANRTSNKTAFIEIFFQDCYRLRHIRKNLKKSDINICDIGGNVGYFSVFSRFIFPNSRIVSYEPNTQAYCTMKDNAELFQFTAHNVAVTNEKRKLVFQQESDTIFGRIIDAPEEYEGALIPATELIKVLEEEKYIHILKLDCEGAEWDLLPQLDASKIGWITMEYHCFEGDHKIEKLVISLKESNFEIVELRQSDPEYGMLLAKSVLS